MVRVTRRHAMGGAALAIAAAALPQTTAAATTHATPSTGLFDDVMTVIERHTGVSRAAILSGGREPEIVWARQRGMYVFKLLSSRSLPEIGRRFGGRDHTTVIYACRKIERCRALDLALDSEIGDLIQACIVESVRNVHRLNPDFARNFFGMEASVPEGLE